MVLYPPQWYDITVLGIVAPHEAKKSKLIVDHRTVDRLGNSPSPGLEWQSEYIALQVEDLKQSWMAQQRAGGWLPRHRLREHSLKKGVLVWICTPTTTLRLPSPDAKPPAAVDRFAGGREWISRARLDALRLRNQELFVCRVGLAHQHMQPLPSTCCQSRDCAHSGCQNRGILRLSGKSHCATAQICRRAQRHVFGSPPPLRGALCQKQMPA